MVTWWWALAAAAQFTRSIQLPAHISARPRAAVPATWPSPFVLQSSVSATGPYGDLAAAISPYVYNTAAGRQGFFRLRSPTITFTTIYSGGQFFMSGPGVPGYNFVLQASTDLVHWINLQTNASPVAFVDPNAWQYPNRSYRAVIAY